MSAKQFSLGGLLTDHPMETRRVRVRAALPDLGAVLVLALAALPLVTVGAFYIDWSVHIWTAAYFRAYFEMHGMFPLLIQTEAWVGDPLPLFYGYLFYPLIALLSPRPELSMLAMAGLFVFLPYFAWREFLGRVLHVQSAAIASLAFSISIYQLTNLYSRSALTEFFAAQCVSAALPLLFSGLIDEAWSLAKARRLATASLFIILAAGFHPITAMIGVSLAGLILLQAAIASQKIVLQKIWQHRISLSCLAVVAALALSGWLAAYLGGYKHLQVTDTTRLAAAFREARIVFELGPTGLLYFLMDKPIYRIFPYSVDPRVLIEPFSQISTPFLTAPLNVAALGLLANLWILRLRIGSWRDLLNMVSFGAVGAAVIIYLVAASCIPSIPYPFGQNLQFAYRIVNFANLWIAALFACLIFLCVFEARQRVSLSPFVLGIAAATIALCIGGKVLEVNNAFAVLQANGTTLRAAEVADSAKNVRTPVRTFYGAMGFTTPGHFEPLGSETLDGTLALSPSADLKIAETMIPRGVCADRCLFRTNILPSPYNDVKTAGGEAKLYIMSDGFLAIEVSRDVTSVTVVPKVNRLSRFLRTFGFAVTALLILTVVGSWVWLLITTLRCRWRGVIAHLAGRNPRRISLGSGA